MANGKKRKGNGWPTMEEEAAEKEAERRAWATVNKESGGGKKSGSGRGKKESQEPSRKGRGKGRRARDNS